MSHQFPLILIAAFYLAAAALLYLSIRKRSESWRNVSFGLAVIGTLIHAGAQYSHWFGHAEPDVGLLHLLSLCALTVMLLLVTSTLSRPALFSAGIVALPIAAGIMLLEWVLPHAPLPLGETSAGIAIHMVSSVLAFGLLSIAGLYALFVFIIDHFLRRHNLNPLIRSLPPLEVMEDLLFKTIAAGFVLLTVSLASGIMFINDIFAQHLVHKTILSILAWLVFGIMLWGRWRYGWRGSVAVRLTLAGMVLLVLSYFGSKLVLEVILGTSWQS
ncbi:MAG: cytochrome c biogenesis protein CcsA [Xanthomonadales bacterium]|nr:cytochrome c biogenesis protein CcsA [Gammaproteobacteria bacterium]MBT8053840.1 cytochrome c biogenesis protein CcsA [Gammaproteobacteria bacterium]NND56421.1 cytochrome c biogenesis protein CcsA [Xanthomonadales bacterium]NNK51807.1 cytochrome c biogenesis protein CcsA [Xanthomonadales bacterium]